MCMRCGYKDQKVVFPQLENTVEDISNINHKNKKKYWNKSNTRYKIYFMYKNDL